MRRLMLFVVAVLTATACGSGSEVTDTTPSPTVRATTAAPDTDPPGLTVTAPWAGSTVAESPSRLAGTTEPFATVTADGRSATADAAGRWSLDVGLDPGANRIAVEAIDQAGNRSSERHLVFFQPPHPLQGMTLAPRWNADNTVLRYLDSSGSATGWSSTAQLPLSWEGDDVGRHLGFAISDPRGDPGNFDKPLDVVFMILDDLAPKAAQERYVVLDAVQVMVPAGAGTVTATCLAGETVQHVAQLEFTSEGPAIARLWSLDPAAGEINEVPPAAFACPELGFGEGGLVVAGVGYPGCLDPEPDCARLVDLSGAVPQLSSWWDHGGMIWGDDGFGFDYAIAQIADTPKPEDEDDWTMWLESFLGWDLDGKPIWRIVDALPIGNPPGMSLICSTSGGTQAFAVLDDPIDPTTVRSAWVIDEAQRRFVAVSGDQVTCEEEPGC